MENIKYNAKMLVSEISGVLDKEMKLVAQGVLECSYKEMLRNRKFEDTFSLDYVKDFCSGIAYDESSLIKYVLEIFSETGYIAEYFRQGDSFMVSVPQKIFVEVAKGNK